MPSGQPVKGDPKINNPKKENAKKLESGFSLTKTPIYPSTLVKVYDDALSYKLVAHPL